jgi:hypothetical protein
MDNVEKHNNYTEVWWWNHQNWLQINGFFSLCPLPDILKNMTFLKLDLFLSSDEGVGGTYSVGFVIAVNVFLSVEHYVVIDYICMYMQFH